MNECESVDESSGQGKRRRNETARGENQSNEEDIFGQVF
jgi:hypothetical protein